MGTKADFYIGKGPEAEWLGSVAFDGYPSGIKKYAGVLSAITLENFRAAVTKMLTERHDATTPEMGWPWPWDNSRTTDYSYLFVDGKVFGSHFGNHPFDPLNEPKAHDEPKLEFPNMVERKNVTFGKRSGLMVLGGPS